MRKALFFLIAATLMSGCSISVYHTHEYQQNISIEIPFDGMVFKEGDAITVIWHAFSENPKFLFLLKRYDPQTRRWDWLYRDEVFSRILDSKIQSGSFDYKLHSELAGRYRIVLKNNNDSRSVEFRVTRRAE